MNERELLSEKIHSLGVSLAARTGDKFTEVKLMLDSFLVEFVALKLVKQALAIIGRGLDALCTFLVLACYLEAKSQTAMSQP